MSLQSDRLPYNAFTYDNWGANPATTFGTSVIPGISNAEGAWTQVATSGNIAQDIGGFHVVVHTGFESTSAKNHLLDIGVDPAGGTAYVAVISNAVVGDSPGPTNTGIKEYHFPLGIKAGSSVAVRIQTSDTTALTVRVAIKFYGLRSRPETYPVGTFSETIGTITTSVGVSFTPGNAADGTWTSLGTTAKDMWWWQLCYQINNSVITNEFTYIDLAYGDATNKVMIMRILHIGSTSETAGSWCFSNLLTAAAYCHVPAGSTMYIRGRCNNAPDTGYNAVAIGIGG